MEFLIVAGFIALLNVALIMAVLGHTGTPLFGGVTKITVGGVNGSPGFPALAFLSKFPHPTPKLSSRSAVKHVM